MWLLSDLAEAFRNRTRYGTLVGMNNRNVSLVRGYNRREDYLFADDKILCKSLLEAGGVSVPPTIATGEGLRDIPRLLGLLRGRSNFVVKPASGSGGDGIVVVGEADEDGWRTAKGSFLSEEAMGRHLAEIVFGAFSNDLEDRILVRSGLCRMRCLPSSSRVVCRTSGSSCWNRCRFWGWCGSRRWRRAAVPTFTRAASALR